MELWEDSDAEQRTLQELHTNLRKEKTREMENEAARLQTQARGNLVIVFPSKRYCWTEGTCLITTGTDRQKLGFCNLCDVFIRTLCLTCEILSRKGHVTMSVLYLLIIRTWFMVDHRHLSIQRKRLAS